MSVRIRWSVGDCVGTFIGSSASEFNNVALKLSIFFSLLNPIQSFEDKFNLLIACEEW